MMRSRTFRLITRFAIGSCALAAAARAEPAELISRNASDLAGNQVSTFSKVAKNGRLVFFMSRATNLAVTDGDSDYDLFLRDRATGTIEHLLVGEGRTDVDGDVHLLDVSSNGRYVGFYTSADHVIPGVLANGSFQGYRFDRATGHTILLTRDHAGQPLSESVYNMSLSRNCKFAAFSTSAPYVVDEVATGDVLAYVFDIAKEKTELVSINDEEELATEDCFAPRVSDDGRFVFFRTSSNDLDSTLVDSNLEYDIFVRDRQEHTTRIASLGTNGLLEKGTGEFAISANGRKLFFVNGGDVVGDGGTYNGLYVREVKAAETRAVALTLSGKAPGGIVGGGIACDKKGRNVAFVSYFTTIVTPDSNGSIRDVFLADSKNGTLELLSVDYQGGGIVDECWHVSIGANGRCISFASDAADLTPTPMGGKQQIFVVDR